MHIRMHGSHAYNISLILILLYYIIKDSSDLTFEFEMWLIFARIDRKAAIGRTKLFAINQYKSACKQCCAENISGATNSIFLDSESFVSSLSSETKRYYSNLFQSAPPLYVAD